MYSNELKSLFKDRGDAAAVFDTLREEVERLAPGQTLRPRVLARQAGIEAWQALGILRMLQEAGAGEVRVQVSDPRRGGIPLETFASASEVPSVMEDSLGEQFDVMPEDMQVVFVPTQGMGGTRQ